MSKPMKCETCWRYLNVPDKRYKPCKDKGVGPDDTPCKQYDPVGPAQCGVCWYFERTYKGKACRTDGKTKTTQACARFRPDVSGVALVKEGPSIKTIDAKHATVFQLREHGAIVLQMDDVVVFVEHVGGERFRVLPTRLLPKGRPPFKLYRDDDGLQVDWLCGTVSIESASGCVTYEDATAVLVEPPKRKKKKRRKKQKRSKRSETTATPTTERRQTEKQALVEKTEPDVASVTSEYQPPDVVLNDLPGLKATLGSMMNVSPEERVNRLLERYAKAVPSLQKEDIRWLREQLENQE